MDLTVSFFSTSYMKHAAGCPSLPPQMKLHFSSLDELPCYSDPHCPNVSDHDDDDDHVHFPSFDRTPESGFIENDPSIDAQSYTLQYSPEHTCNQHGGTGGTSDEDAIYLNARPDEQLPPHQFHTNLSGSDVELLQPPSLGDNNNFPKTMLPTLKKHVYPCNHLPAVTNLNDYTSPSKEEPFRQAVPFLREEPSSTFDYLSATNTCIFINESPEEKRPRPKGSVDIIVSPSSTAIEPVEVIDLYTPPPDCRITVSKKRRISSDCSDFIDLTNSPLFL